MTNAGPSKRKLSDFVKEAGEGLAKDTKLLLGLVTSSFVVLKVLSVSHLELSTALAIIASVGTVSVVIGAIVAMMPYFVALLAMLALLGIAASALGQELERTRTAQVTAMFLLLVTGLLTVLLSPWPLTLLTILLGAGIIKFGLHKRPERSDNWLLDFFTDLEIAVWRRIGTLLASLWAIAALVMVLNTGLWLPAERVVVAGNPPLTSYVLNQSSGWTTVLTHSDRKVLRIRTEKIERRSVCRIGGGLQARMPSIYGLARVLFGAPTSRTSKC